MFHFIKSNLQKIYTSITNKLGTLFTNNTIDETTLKELELILLQADTGVKTTKTIIEQLKTEYTKGTIRSGTELKKALCQQLHALLKQTKINIQDPDIILLVGINGSGKTTTAAKIAYHAHRSGKRTLFVAADTFRAAAPEQLSIWASKIDATIELGTQDQDPASVVFNGSKRFIQEEQDLLIIDTAGRLQTKTNLMQELEKIKRVITKQLPHKKIATYVTIDAMLGQNSFEQAQLFHESTDLSGIILTKMDGTGKGGIIFAIADQLGIPVVSIAYGEQIESYKPFDQKVYVEELIGN